MGCMSDNKFFILDEKVCASASAPFIPSNKFCSVVRSGNWRGTTAVPSSWTNTLCADFAIQLRAITNQMGSI